MADEHSGEDRASGQGGNQPKSRLEARVAAFQEKGRQEKAKRAERRNRKGSLPRVGVVPGQPLPSPESRPIDDLAFLDGMRFLNRRTVIAIYFIQVGENGPIKVGQTRESPMDRLRDLQVGNPHPLRVRAVMMTRDDRAESSIHRRFAAIRMSGEWFRPEPELIEFIRIHGLSWQEVKGFWPPIAGEGKRRRRMLSLDTEPELVALMKRAWYIENPFEDEERAAVEEKIDEVLGQWGARPKPKRKDE